MIWVENPDFQKHPCQSVDLGLPTRLIDQQKYFSPFQRCLPNEIHDLHRNQVHLSMVPSCPESSQSMEKTEGFTASQHQHTRKKIANHQKTASSSFFVSSFKHLKKIVHHFWTGCWFNWFPFPKRSQHRTSAKRKSWKKRHWHLGVPMVDGCFGCLLGKNFHFNLRGEPLI